MIPSWRRGIAPIEALECLLGRRARLAKCSAGAVLIAAGFGCGTSKAPGGESDEHGAALPQAEATGRASFVDATQRLGLGAVPPTQWDPAYFMPDIVGSGCGLFDADGDGDLDLYVARGSRDRSGRTITESGADLFFRQGPDGRFQDDTEAAGLGRRGYSTGVGVGDLDNDGDLDLYVAAYGRDTLYLNAGDGTFEDVTDAAGIGGSGWSTSVALFDHDLDGYLDVFVARYLDHDPARSTTDASGRPEYSGPEGFAGVPDRLYRNRGDATFEDVSERTGIASTPGKGLGVACLDLDDDGLLDVYVANDGEANHAWMNRGDRFVEEALLRGLALNDEGQAEAGMGVAVDDLDGDGDEDLVVTHLVLETHTLYARTAPGRFRDATRSSGVGLASLDVTGFGAVTLDADLDGDVDLAVANGRVLRQVAHPLSGLDEHWTPYAEPNHLFMSDGAGRFELVDAGAFSEQVDVSRGLVAGDVDGDGDQDLVLTNCNTGPRVFLNETARRGHWLSVRAVDPALRRDAIGATVELILGERRLRRRLLAGSSYLSAGDPRLHFGLGSHEGYEAILVTWPGGPKERFPGGPADRVLELRKGTAP